MPAPVDPQVTPDVTTVDAAGTASFTPDQNATRTFAAPATPAADPWPVGPLVRVYAEDGGVLDLRTQLASAWPVASEQLAALIGGSVSARAAFAPSAARQGTPISTMRATLSGIPVTASTDLAPLSLASQLFAGTPSHAAIGIPS